MQNNSFKEGNLLQKVLSRIQKKKERGKQLFIANESYRGHINYEHLLLTIVNSDWVFIHKRLASKPEDEQREIRESLNNLFKDDQFGDNLFEPTSDSFAISLS